MGAALDAKLEEIRLAGVVIPQSSNGNAVITGAVNAPTPGSMDDDETPAGDQATWDSLMLTVNGAAETIATAPALAPAYSDLQAAVQSQDEQRANVALMGLRLAQMNSFTSRAVDDALNLVANAVSSYLNSDADNDRDDNQPGDDQVNIDSFHPQSGSDISFSNPADTVELADGSTGGDSDSDAGASDNDADDGGMVGGVSAGNFFIHSGDGGKLHKADKVNGKSHTITSHRVSGDKKSMKHQFEPGVSLKKVATPSMVKASNDVVELARGQKDYKRMIHGALRSVRGHGQPGEKKEPGKAAFAEPGSAAKATKAAAGLRPYFNSDAEHAKFMAEPKPVLEAVKNAVEAGESPEHTIHMWRQLTNIRDAKPSGMQSKADPKAPLHTADREFMKKYPSSPNAPGLSPNTDKGGVFDGMTKGSGETVTAEHMAPLIAAAKAAKGSPMLHESEIHDHLQSQLGKKPSWEQFGQATTHARNAGVKTMDSFGQAKARPEVMQAAKDAAGSKARLVEPSEKLDQDGQNDRDAQKQRMESRAQAASYTAHAASRAANAMHLPSSTPMKTDAAMAAHKEAAKLHLDAADKWMHASDPSKYDNHLEMVDYHQSNYATLAQKKHS